MRRISVLATGVLAASLAGLVGLVGALPGATAAPAEASGGPSVFVGELDHAQFSQLTALGIDREDIVTQASKAKTKISVEVILSPYQAAETAGPGSEPDREEDRRQDRVQSSQSPGRKRIYGLPLVQ